MDLTQMMYWVDICRERSFTKTCMVTKELIEPIAQIMGTMFQNDILQSMLGQRQSLIFHHCSKVGNQRFLGLGWVVGVGEVMFMRKNSLKGFSEEGVIIILSWRQTKNRNGCFWMEEHENSKKLESISFDEFSNDLSGFEDITTKSRLSGHAQFLDLIITPFPLASHSASTNSSQYIFSFLSSAISYYFDHFFQHPPFPNPPSSSGWLSLKYDNFACFDYLLTAPLHINLMDRRISKASTNYQNHKSTSDHLFKKQSCNQQAWKIFSSEPATALDSHSRTLSLFFDNPQFLLGCRRLEHFSQAQRLRQGVCILMRGKIRVLLCKQARNAGKMEIEHAIFNMENRPRSKCCLGYNKLNIIEVNQPYQIVMSSNNCLAMPETSLWFIPAEELAELQFYEKLKKLRGLLAETSDVFQVDSELPFIYRHLIFSFRSVINLSTDIEVAIVKKGDVMVQWSSNPLQKLIISEGSVIHKSKDYNYFCHSSEVELIGVRVNTTFKFVADPLWTKRPATGKPVLPKEQSKDKILLFRSRSKNLEKLTSNSKNRKFFKQTKSLTRSSSTQNKQFPSKSAISFGSLQSHKQKWLFMRKIQGYQVASNTRSQVEYKRIDALRERFKKENVRSPRERHEALLCKKVKKNKISFSHLPSKKETIYQRSHLFDSVSNFFKKQMSQHH